MSDLSQEPTKLLVDWAGQGRQEAVEALCARFQPRLVRWAHGRLPKHSRQLKDTEDLVQETLTGVVGKISTFRNENEQSFVHYVRRALRNRLLNEIRRADHENRGMDKLETVERQSRSPFDDLVDRESIERYEAALAKLRAEEQDLVILRLDLDTSFMDIALYSGFPSADAARMAVSRAIRKMATIMEP